MQPSPIGNTLRELPPSLRGALVTVMVMVSSCWPARLTQGPIRPQPPSAAARAGRRAASARLQPAPARRRRTPGAIAGPHRATPPYALADGRDVARRAPPPA